MGGGCRDGVQNFGNFEHFKIEVVGAESCGESLKSQIFELEGGKSIEPRLRKGILLLFEDQ